MSTLAPGGADPAQNWINARLLDRYYILSSLGSGPHGTVYLGTDSLSGRTVAVKVPFLRLLPTTWWRERFETEMSGLTAWSHPGLVRVLDVGLHLGMPFVVSRYLAGGSLETRLAERGGGLMPLEVLEWLPGVAKALDYAHRKGRLHRDLKPGNLLFDSNGNAQLSDLGLVSALADPQSGRSATGELLGPAEMLPPEAMHGKYGPAADQYGLASVLWRCVCGTETPSPRAEASTRPAHLPARAAQALLKGLSAEPRDRHGTCSDLARAFERGLSREPGSAHPGPLDPTAPAAVERRPEPPRSSLLDAALVTVVLVAGIGGASLMRVIPPRGAEPPALRRLRPLPRPVPHALLLRPTQTPTLPPTPTPRAPTSTPAPTDTPLPPTATPTPSDAQIRIRAAELARSGDLSGAADLFDAVTANRPTAYTVQLSLTARDTTVQGAFAKAQPEIGLLLFNAKTKGRWALCAGVFEDQDDARKAARAMPKLFDGQQPTVHTFAQVFDALR
jgi:serine/threonine protein kinase